MRHALFVLSALALENAAWAQATWSVPNNGDVSSVIGQAAPGDIVQLAATHPPFNLSKGVVVMGAAGGTTLTHPAMSGFSASMTVDIPAGQRASLMNVNLAAGYNGYSWSDSVLALAGGQCEVSNVGASIVVVSGGCHVLQRIPPVRLQVSGGICSLSNSTLAGVAVLNSYGLPTGGQYPGLWQSGGQLLASKVTLTGPHGGILWNPAPAAEIVGGTAWFTDSTITGGSTPFGAAGAPALVGNGSVRTARTTLTNGTGGQPTPPSSGFLPAPTMVGLWCDSQPVVGGTFTIRATAGSSLDMMGLVIGIDATPNSVPNVVEPVFGDLSSLIVVLLGYPPVGGVVTTPLAVPNNLSLRGHGVWLQAVQVDGAMMRASAVVGGTMR